MQNVLELADSGAITPVGRLYNFATGRSELLPVHEQWLRSKIVPELRRSSPVYIRLWGYASKSGSAQLNQRLSLERAAAAKRYLEQCVAQSLDLVEVGGYGESRSAGPETDNSPIYRAVDVYVYRTPVPPPRPVSPPDVSMRVPNVYFGLGVKFGGHLAIGRQTIEAALYSGDSYESWFHLEAEAWTAGAILGGGFNLVFIIGTGATNRGEFRGLKFDGWDFSVSLGARWGDVAKAAKNVPAAARIAKAIGTGANAQRALRSLTKLSYGEWQSLADLVKTSREALGADSAATSPQLNAFDLPLAGAALEVGIYKWWATVTSVS